MKGSSVELELPSPPRQDGPPLRAHPNGQWYKQHNKRRYYFGPWAPVTAPVDEQRKLWDEAVKDFNWRWTDIASGKPDPKFTTVTSPDRVTLDELGNVLLKGRLERKQAGKIQGLTYRDVRNAVKFMLDFTGDQGQLFRHRAAAHVPPDEWRRFRNHLEASYGPDVQNRWVRSVYRSIFNLAQEKYKVALNCGGALDLVPRSAIRNERRQQDRMCGPKLFPREQVPLILEACPAPLDAMFLLSINCGFGASDCASLTLNALNLDEGYFEFDRVKTGVMRSGFLWPVTVDRLRKAIANRPEVNQALLNEAVVEWESKKPEGRESIRQWERRRPDWNSLVFLRCRRGHGAQRGVPWIIWREGQDPDDLDAPVPTRTDRISGEFTSVLEGLDEKHKKGVGGLKFKRPRRGFYVGRHTFYTRAKRIDVEAADYIMGHSDESMGEWYDHLDDEKLELLFRISMSVGSQVLPKEKTVPHTNLVKVGRLRLVGLDDAVAVAG
jgi:integrase